MTELIVKYPDRGPDHFPLGRLRITIGRSARNDLCIPDPFASRVHAEVRREGDEHILQDLGSANGTLYNGATVEGAIHLTTGGRIQIGETEIIFDDGTFNSGLGATMITDNSGSNDRARVRRPHDVRLARSHRRRAHATGRDRVVDSYDRHSESCEAGRLAGADQQSGNHAPRVGDAE